MTVLTSKLTAFMAFILILVFPMLLYSSEESTQYLTGEYDSSSRWKSGWLDLAKVTDFSVGDRLQLTIGDTAEKIIVRLLAKGQSPDSSSGIVGGTVTVPQSRVVEIELHTDLRGIIQISVHGGTNPWGRFPLGGGNGSATLEAAYLISKVK